MPMNQYEVIIKHTAYRKVLVCGKDEDVAYDEAMYIAKITDWNNSDCHETTIQAIKEVTSGE